MGALRFVLERSVVRRLGRGVPVVELVLAAEVAMMARSHLVRLDGDERRRLLALLREAHGRPGTLGEAEREEFGALVAQLEPRLFAGSAVRKLSPVPLPKRVLFGRRGSAARLAARR